MKLAFSILFLFLASLSFSQNWYGGIKATSSWYFGEAQTFDHPGSLKMESLFSPGLAFELNYLHPSDFGVGMEVFSQKMNVGLVADYPAHEAKFVEESYGIMQGLGMYVFLRKFIHSKISLQPSLGFRFLTYNGGSGISSASANAHVTGGEFQEIFNTQFDLSPHYFISSKINVNFHLSPNSYLSLTTGYQKGTRNIFKGQFHFDKPYYLSDQGIYSSKGDNATLEIGWNFSLYQLNDQSDAAKGEKGKNLFFLEFGGVPGIASLNYERIIWDKNWYALSVRTGAGLNYEMFLPYWEYRFPLTINHSFGGNNHHLETDLGAQLALLPYFEPTNAGMMKTAGYYPTLELIGGVGYRYQSDGDGLFFKAMLYPMYRTKWDIFDQRLGISVGYTL